MVIVPDAPVQLTNDFAVTNKQIIQFTWQDGIKDGGSPVLQYRISFDQATDTWVYLQDGITIKQFTTSLPLLVGRYYKFRVEAKNSVGYSAFSAPISILTAQIPATPAPPTTTLIGYTIVITWV